MNKTAFRFDEVSATNAVKDILSDTDNLPRSQALAYLLGARHAMIHGGIPHTQLVELDAIITWYEKNRDMGTGAAERLDSVQWEEKSEAFV